MAVLVTTERLDGVAEQAFGFREALHLLAVLEHDDALPFRTDPDAALVILHEGRGSERSPQIHRFGDAIVDTGYAFHRTAYPDGP